MAAAVMQASSWRQAGALLAIVGAMVGAWVAYKLILLVLWQGSVGPLEFALASAGFIIVAACLYAYRRIDPFARYFFPAVASLPVSLVAAAPVIHYAGGPDRAWLGAAVMLPAVVLYVPALRRYREERLRA